MKKSRFTDEQIIGFLRQAEGGMQRGEATQLREIERGNARIKKLLAEAHSKR
ncbi:hypothetical protein [Delftia acidovorans]|uniref:hypothetical protein n=1 Tax=Delftia acidovorans TaxID=80866 RepID=UPI003C6D3933